MKAVINPRSGVWKEMTDEAYKKDKAFLEADGFRLMNEKEIEKYLKVKKVKPQKKEPIINQEKK